MSVMRTDAQDPAADADLIRAVLLRKPGAWQTFFKRHERLILACVRRVFYRYHVPLPAEDLEDLVGAVCLDLVKENYKKLVQFDATKGYRLSSWVGLIATNAAHDALRRRLPGHQSIDDETSAVPDLESHELDPLSALEQKERVALLARALACLSEADREFVLLYYGEQRSPEDIASSTGVSINTIYSRKNKVRAKLVRLVRGFTRTDALRDL
jgi:RNA polymerase sigma-70 factor (ECF subfamily)